MKSRMKAIATERKIRSLSLYVAELERKIREAAVLRRENIKYQLTYRLATYTGLLHMVLRYSVLLKPVRQLQ